MKHSFLEFSKKGFLSFEFSFVTHCNMLYCNSGTLVEAPKEFQFSPEKL